MNLSDYINKVAEGRKPASPPTEPFGIHYGCGIKKSGMLTLYVSGRQCYTKKCASAYERKDQMKKMLQRAGSYGSKYFKWIPDNL
jgi:hypothetical protein